MARCPSCRGEVKPRKENAAFPFCSMRCKQKDLGKWFTGEYAVPGPPVIEEAPRRRDDDEE